MISARCETLCRLCLLLRPAGWQMGLPMDFPIFSKLKLREPPGPLLQLIHASLDLLAQRMPQPSPAEKRTNLPAVTCWDPQLFPQFLQTAVVSLGTSAASHHSTSTTKNNGCVATSHPKIAKVASCSWKMLKHRHVWKLRRELSGSATAPHLLSWGARTPPPCWSRQHLAQLRKNLPGWKGAQVQQKKLGT